MDNKERYAALGRDMAARLQSNARAAGIMFVLEAESDTSRLDAQTILDNKDLFVVWDEHYATSERGKILLHPVDGNLYKNIHPIIDEAQNIDPMTDTAGAMWRKIADASEEWPAWSQPIAGVDEPYTIGDKVSCDGKRWTSDIDNNWWKPGEYGWAELISRT